MPANIHAALYTAVALFLLTLPGNWACRLLFRVIGMKNPMAGGIAQAAGRTIGWLERLIIAMGIVSQSWEVLAAVIALKTVARFKELDKQLSAEYFLVGSLFSVFWAMLVTGAWLVYDHDYGIDVHQAVVQMLHPEPSSTEVRQEIAADATSTPAKGRTAAPTPLSSPETATAPLAPRLAPPPPTSPSAHE